MSFRSNIFGQRLYTKVIDLSIGTVYANALQLIFTTLSGAVSYDVFVDDIYKITITNSENFVVGSLQPNTEYSLRIAANFTDGSQSALSNVAIGFTNNTYYSYSATEIFSFRKIIPTATVCCKVQRLNDLAFTEILFPASGFISLSSEVTAGGTLGAWAGANDVIIETLYGQQGFRNLIRYDVYTKDRLITAGVLETLNGKPAIKSSLTGKGLVAVDFLPATHFISNTSLFYVYEAYMSLLPGHPSYAAAMTQNRPLGWGSSQVNGATTTRSHLNPAADNTIRFDGGALVNNQVPYQLNIPVVRGTHRSLDNFYDYVNMDLNIQGSITTGGIKKDLVVGAYGDLTGLPSRDFRFSEAIVFADSTALTGQAAIMDEINNAFNIY